MEENENDNWMMGTYIVNSKLSQCALEARGNQAPSDLMFG